MATRDPIPARGRAVAAIVAKDEGDYYDVGVAYTEDIVNGHCPPPMRPFDPNNPPWDRKDRASLGARATEPRATKYGVEVIWT